MRIAFIFAHRPSDVWSTPLSIVNQFKKIGWDTKIYSLFDYADNYVDSNIQELINSDYNPDIVMYMDWGRFDSVFLDKKCLPDSYWIMESGDDPQNFDRNSIKAHKFDLVLTPAYDSYLKYTDMGINVEWWTHFADTNIHKPSLKHDGIKQPVRSTRGYGGSQLMDYLTALLPDKFLNKNGLNGLDYGLFLSSAKITLQHSRHKEVTRRLFEAAACNSMILTDRLPDYTNINRIFTEGQDIVYYDSIPECISKINYYLSEEGRKERESITLSAYWNVITEHTQIQRVDTIIKKFEQWKENSQ